MFSSWGAWQDWVMTIQLVGAGVGRTGTHSLKGALELLLGGTCHHMMEVTDEQGSGWYGAFTGDPPDWPDFLAGYCAIVDWPGASAWRQTAAAFPDAPVLLSTRSSVDVWFESATNTIFKAIASIPKEDAGPQGSFIGPMMKSFCAGDWDDPAVVKAAYEAHNAAVREAIPAERLFEYQPGDGWGPLCAALGLAEPDQPFPHTNTTEEFRRRLEK